MAKILVVDDDQVVRDILERVLSGAGHDVVLVDDGIYATRAIEKEKPDLVICDIQMPRLGGDELIGRLKSDPIYRRTKIMILTALGEPVRWLQDEVSADAFMSKPFKNEEMVKRVEELLGKNRVRIAPRKPYPSEQPPWVKSIPLFITVISVGLIIFLAINFAYNQFYAVPLFEKPDAQEKGNVSFLADKLFLFALPIFLAVIGYVVYLLNRIASKKN